MSTLWLCCVDDVWKRFVSKKQNVLFLLDVQEQAAVRPRDRMSHLGLEHPVLVKYVYSSLQYRHSDSYT